MIYAVYKLSLMQTIIAPTFFLELLQGSKLCTNTDNYFWDFQRSPKVSHPSTAELARYFLKITLKNTILDYDFEHSSAPESRNYFLTCPIHFFSVSLNMKDSCSCLYVKSKIFKR